MSKRALTILLAALLSVGIFSTVTNAGVEGSFTFHISMHPQEVCWYDVPDVAQEAHAVKAAVEDFATDVGEYCSFEFDEVYQPLLELADLVLPVDYEAVAAKVAEIKTALDPCKTALEEELDYDEALCEAVPKETIIGWEDKKADVEDWLDGEGDDFLFEYNEWNDAFDAFSVPTYTQTMSFTSYCTGLGYLNEGEFDEAFTDEWGEFGDEIDEIGEKIDMVNKLLRILNKKMEQYGIPAAIDCPYDGPAELVEFIEMIIPIITNIDEWLVEIETELDWLKGEYKPFLNKQIGVFDAADFGECGKHIEVWMLLTEEGLNDEVGDLFGPGGMLYDLNEKIETIIDEKEELEEEVLEVRAMYDPEGVIAGYLADLNAIYLDLDDIAVKEWDLICEPPSNELAKFDFDFEALLDLNFTISGLTIGNHLAMGIAGLEHYVLSFATTLGALDLKDEFWFAAPYDANMNKLGPIQFVKKRVTAEITIGGLSFETLVVFEDVLFDHPYVPPLLPPLYGFGAAFTVEGQTVSGIGVKSVTAFCLDPQETNAIKKYSAGGRVNEICAYLGIPEEDAGKTPMFFEVEKLYLTGIAIGPLTIDTYTEFRPFLPISQTVDVEFVMPFGITADLSLDFSDITQLLITSATYSFALDSVVVITVYDNDGDLTLSAADALNVVITFPVQEAAFMADITTVPTVGMTGLSIAADIPVAVGTFGAGVSFAGPPLTMSAFVFSYATTVGDIDFSIDTTFTMIGLDNAVIEIGIPFAV